jgi:glucokinase
VIAAVDIGGSKIAVAMVDQKGCVVARAQTPTQPEQGYSASRQRIEEMLRKVSADSGAKITGIGIGCTGPINPFTGEIGFVNFFPDWEGENPVANLSQTFGVPVAIENDADAAALAEAAWGTGRNKNRLIYITVGTGIGAGLIFDGKLYRGVEQSHPEIGHHVIDPSGPQCLCGFRGCWESLASGPSMVAWFQSEVPAQTNYGDISAQKICDLAVGGDPLAIRAVERESYYLGLGIANVISMFVPDSVVLSGGVMQSADLFLADIKKIVGESCGFVPFASTDLRLASLGADANLIGAARVWHHRFAQNGDERAL